MGFLTPDTVPTGVTCRALFIPDSEEYLAIVRGVIQELTFSYNWSAYGAVTPEQAAQSCMDMFDRLCLTREPCRMIGEIIAYAGNASPNANMLVCDGSEVAIATYPDLYAVVGSTYGVSSNPGTLFRLPDLRGRAISGTGTGTGLSPITLGQSYGEETHTLTLSELATHSHSTMPHSHSELGATATVINGGLEAPAASAVPTGAITGQTTVSVNNSGGGEAHNTIGPRLGVTYLIVALEG